MATKKKSTGRKSSSGSTPKSKKIVHNKMEKTMHEYKHHDLKSGRGGKVKSRKQAIAIGLSEARRAGADIPAKPSKKKSAKKSTLKRSSTGSRKKSTAKKSTSSRSRAKRK